MHAEARERLDLIQDLRSATEKGELELQYQPKFRANDLALVGVEALLRWRHPSRGLVPPDGFIPLAERTGLIIPIGHWVIDEACRQMAKWRRLGHDQWNVAVNLSALQLLDPQLSEKVRAALKKYRLEPRHLILEVTETTAMKNIDVSMRILQELHDIGVKISIDDFGTGYSSLMHLKRLPATELKIDRGFVRELTDGSEDAAIVSAIIALGKTLNLSVVAEGVETQEQQEFLTRIGCTSLQGFLLGRPGPAEALSTSSAQAVQWIHTEPGSAPLIKPEAAAWGRSAGEQPEVA
jgi:EAL domain-containing protein (putative c-di-GMP-specific phosphodiesterase class I)